MNLNERDEIKFVILYDRPDFSNKIHAEEDWEEADEEDVPDLHQPGCDEAGEADGINSLPHSSEKHG